MCAYTHFSHSFSRVVIFDHYYPSKWKTIDFIRVERTYMNWRYFNLIRSFTIQLSDWMWRFDLMATKSCSDFGSTFDSWHERKKQTSSIIKGNAIRWIRSFFALHCCEPVKLRSIWVFDDLPKTISKHLISLVILWLTLRQEWRKEKGCYACEIWI